MHILVRFPGHYIACRKEIWFKNSSGRQSGLREETHKTPCRQDTLPKGTQWIMRAKGFMRKHFSCFTYCSSEDTGSPVVTVFILTTLPVLFILWYWRQLPVLLPSHSMAVDSGHSGSCNHGGQVAPSHQGDKIFQRVCSGIKEFLDAAVEADY